LKSASIDGARCKQRGGRGPRELISIAKVTESAERHRLWAHIAILIVVLAGAIATEYVQALFAERSRQASQSEALAMLSQLRSALANEINTILYRSSGLISYVTLRPESGPEDWVELAAELMRTTRYIHNIGLAPGNRLLFVYPLQGNEGAIGLRYEENPRQWPAVQEAIQTRKMVLAGPLELVQGGQGLIVRAPIYRRAKGRGDGSYWGMASVVIDADALFAAAGVADNIGQYEVALRGVDGKGAAGALIFGREALFKQPLAQLEVVFPQGSWLLAAQIHDSARPGWLARNLPRGAGYSFLFIIVVLLLILERLYYCSRGEAMHDSLTGLPNRRLLMERITQLAALHERTGLSFALYFVDLNDFKPINDQHGHPAGDAVLREVGRRLQALVRNSDTVARTGGDEFMVLQPAVESPAAALLVADKIEGSLAEGFNYHQQGFRLSAAVGYAIYPQDADSVERLIMLADAQMYQRKTEMKLSARR